MPVDKTVVDPESAGKRLDVFLTDRFSVERQKRGMSRSAIQRLITAGRVSLNNRRAKPGARIKAQDVIEIQWLPLKERSLMAEAVALEVLHDDDECVVINKAPGVVVHPAAGHAQGTLVNALLHAYPGLEGIGGEGRPGIVHRLDKETSGVMIVAKNDFAYQKLARQFKDRTVTKEYLTVVWGKLPAVGGIIDRPIGRHRSDRKRMSSLRALPRTRQAVTEWKLENCFPMDDHQSSWRWVSLLRVRPRTGRTHQIRVHLADLGHPVVGDKVYGHKGRKGSKKSPLDDFPRQALHAERLEIVHPRTGKRMVFCAPLPEDMKKLLQHLSLKEPSCGAKPVFGRGG
jgi:23S rRNA pseudouridine1911/1915/1917 synthase